MKLPDSYKEKMKDLLKDEYEDYIKCFDKTRYYGIRLNRLKITNDDFFGLMDKEYDSVPWTENGFYYDDREKMSKLPYYYAGLYYIQEPSAMSPAAILDIKEGEKVLDLCAAPGGKTTELGARLNGKGMLVANDISASRAKALLKNIELFGIKNALVLSENPKKLENYFYEYFDKILLDAPCSGEGMFRKDNAIIKSWERNGPEFYSEIQRELILQAADMLKPGGTMLFSTCTFSPMENEQTVRYLLDNRDDFTVLDIKKDYGFVEGMTEYGEEMRGCARLFPHKIKGEGHFLALLKKDGVLTDTIKKKSSATVKESELEEMKEYLEDINFSYSFDRLYKKEERVFLLPEDFPEVKGLRILRAGLYLGDQKKKRFEPSQAFAMSFKKDEYPYTINLKSSDDRVIKYLKGDTIDLNDDDEYKEYSWQLVCVDGYPLGFAKLTNGKLKNKYHQGWRWQ